MTISTISTRAFAELRASNQNVDLVDVRTPVEFREVHVDVARNVPLGQMEPAALMKSRNGSSDQPMYVICRSGNRAKQACERIAAAGYNNVVNVEGGTQAWEAAGLPVIRGKKAISLERQVRVAAGLLVLVGIALAWFPPAFVGISALVGAGLIFAGVTDTCGMGLLLAKMPWNQISTECENN